MRKERALIINHLQLFKTLIVHQSDCYSSQCNLSIHASPFFFKLSTCVLWLTALSEQTEAVNTIMGFTLKMLESWNGCNFSVPLCTFTADTVFSAWSRYMLSTYMCDCCSNTVFNLWQSTFSSTSLHFKGEYCIFYFIYLTATVSGYCSDPGF